MHQGLLDKTIPSYRPVVLILKPRFLIEQHTVFPIPKVGVLLETVILCAKLYWSLKNATRRFRVQARLLSYHAVLSPRRRVSFSSSFSLLGRRWNVQPNETMH